MGDFFGTLLTELDFVLEDEKKKKSDDEKSGSLEKSGPGESPLSSPFHEV